MANHGKTGEELQKYLDRKRVERDVYAPNPKTGVYEKITVKGRYEKPSYLKRKADRANNRKEV